MVNLNITEVEINSNDLFPLLLNPNKEQLSMDVSASHDRIKFKDFTLSCKRKSDCCCYLSDGSICSISCIGKKNNHPVILRITLKDPQPLPNYPCNSFDMKICCGNKWSKLKEFKAIEITNKTLHLSEDDNDDEPIPKNNVKKNDVSVISDSPKSYKPHIIDRKIEASTSGAEKKDLLKLSDHEKIGNAQKDNMKQDNDNNTNDFCNESFVYDDQSLDYGDYLADYSLQPIEEISEIKTTMKSVHEIWPEYNDKNLKLQEHVNMKKNITSQLKNVDKYTHRLQYNQDLSILNDKPKIRSVVNTSKFCCVSTDIPVRIATCTARKKQKETLQFQDDSNFSKQIRTDDDDENDESSTYQHCTFCCKACRHNLQVILHKINAIGMHFIDLNSNEPQQNDGNILLKFPIVTIEELKNFNKLLKEDASVCAKYTKLIKNIGGEDVKEHVQQALALILNDEFSCKLSWTGQKETIQVKDMKFVDIMIEYMINSGRNCTIFDVQNIIQKWLQRASDRVRYTEKKHTQT